MSDTFEWETFKEQLEYLRKRGLGDPWTIKRLGLRIATEHQLGEIGIKRTNLQRGILWTLRNLKGEPRGKYGARVWYRQGFHGNEDEPKFLPPKGQVPGLYYSPLCDWSKLPYGARIFICESYLKADVVALMGHYAVGISGVWGWSYEKQLNWDFQELPWKDYDPVILFDSNVCEDRPSLLQAAHKLRVEMEVRHHADVRLITLPPKGKDEHWGIDDFYMAHGADATKALLDSEPQAMPNPLLEHLKIMNTEVCVVKKIGKFVNIATGDIWTRSIFEDVVYADRMALDSEGKRVSVAKSWTRWDGRTAVQELVYRPGADRILPGEFYNTWKGMGVEPVAGNVDLFLSWVHTVFQTDTERLFFLNWWAWQLQNPGKKLTTALVIVGKSGIGKGWMARIAELIYSGANVSKISLGGVISRFNSHIAEKQLLIVEESDEMGGKDGAVIYNKLKDMITSTTVTVEKKGIDAYTVDNVINCFLTGNKVGIFKPDEFDRRLAVCEAIDPVGPDGPIANSNEYWKPRWEWIERGGGAAMIYGYLKGRDLTGFDPYGEAPRTKAKVDMIEMTHEPLEVWIHDLLEAPSENLVVRGAKVDGRLFTAKELLFIYHDGQQPMADLKKGEIMKMGNALKNARARVANSGGKIKVNGVSERYFLLEGEDTSDNWAGEVKGRAFFGRLVASTGGPVAKGGPDGNPGTKW